MSRRERVRLWWRDEAARPSRDLSQEEWRVLYRDTTAAMFVCVVGLAICGPLGGLLIGYLVWA